MLVRKKDSGEIFAMKILKKEMLEKRNQRFHTKTERAVLAKMKTPFVVQLYYAFQTPEKLYLVMEYLPGGELFFHLRKAKKFDEARAVFYAAEITLALEYLHKNNIIYRDLKPENILLDQNGHVKLTDLGLSKEGVAFGKAKTYTFCGTPEYLAPEIISGTGHNKAVDWWSLGALIYEMLTGRSPFANENRKQMLKNILKKPPEMRSYFSEEAKNILKRLLCVDPLHRLGSSEQDAEEIKADPFFRSINWKELEGRRTQPPFKPEVKSKEDCQNVDRLFLKEAPVDTPTTGMRIAGPGDVNYDGFTYARQEMSIKNDGLNI
eukprot:TRINITY_DN4286_c0_g1_i12.p1 TRINITY_DN4286_c0_g1~~TRINITY_DN4286_c0_g1_i12.p1  ORF type:complete len:321 (-),score=95.68 TRINITY_DN4286_c0_g1_i12:167-1129(-)